jgi:hypothetical protein
MVCLFWQVRTNRSGPHRAWWRSLSRKDGGIRRPLQRIAGRIGRPQDIPARHRQSPEALSLIIIPIVATEIGVLK